MCTYVIWQYSDLATLNCYSYTGAICTNNAGMGITPSNKVAKSKTDFRIKNNMEKSKQIWVHQLYWTKRGINKSAQRRANKSYRRGLEIFIMMIDL